MRQLNPLDPSESSVRHISIKSNKNKNTNTHKIKKKHVPNLFAIPENHHTRTRTFFDIPSPKPSIKKPLPSIKNIPPSKDIQHLKKSGTIIYKDNAIIPVIYKSKCNDEKFINKLKGKGILPHNYRNELVCDKNIYDLGSIIGEGTYNVVYNISNRMNYTDNELVEHPLVLREMLKDYHGNETIIEDELTGLFIQTYLSKTKGEGGLGCDKICKIYDFGIFEDEKGNELGVYAILEKLVALDTFLKYISNNNNFHIMFDSKTDIFFLKIKKIILDVLKGLECMHDNLYAHFDLKLNNIAITNLIETKDNIGNMHYKIIDENNWFDAKIIDFGFSKKFKEKTSVLPFDYDIDLIANYHPPEMIFFNKGLIKSDIYMFGEMLYNLFLIDRYNWFHDFFKKYPEFNIVKAEINTLLTELNILFPQKINAAYIQKSAYPNIELPESDNKELWNTIMQLNIRIENKKKEIDTFNYQLNNLNDTLQENDNKKEGKNIFKRIFNIFDKNTNAYLKLYQRKIQEEKYYNELINKYKSLVKQKYNILIQEINEKRSSATDIMLHNSTLFGNLDQFINKNETKYRYGGKKRRSNRDRLPRRKRTNTRKNNKKK